MKVNPHRSSLDMNANTLALLCYVAAFFLSWVPVVRYVAWAAPLVIFFLEKQSPFVKFHAMQAFLLEVIDWIVAVIAAIIKAILWTPFSWGFSIINVVLTILAIVALVKAAGYYEFKIPVIGDLAERFCRNNVTF